MSVLEVEMIGYFKNYHREYYGEKIRPLDFKVEGIGKYTDITHVEVKGPVGTEILLAEGRRPRIIHQGKKIGKKLNYQQNLWTNKVAVRERVTGLKISPPLPKSPQNIMSLIDLVDVRGPDEKTMVTSINESLNNNLNTVFINNSNNIN